MDLLPVNVPQATVVSRASAAGVNSKAPNPPSVDDLASWSQENYQLDTSAAAHLGFPIATIGVDAKRSILIFGTSRWADVDSGDGHVYRFGVALRVLVEVSGIDLKGGVTLPQVAANVEITSAKASAQLLVRGYGGDLGTLLPPWQAFNVDSYTQYMSAISDIQRRIMGADDGHIKPQLLATTIAAPALPPLPDAHAGTVHALRGIAGGLSLQGALDAADSAGLSQDARAAVQQEYEQHGLDGDQAPSPQTAEEAKGELGTADPVHRRFLDHFRGNKVLMDIAI